MTDEQIHPETSTGFAVGGEQLPPYPLDGSDVCPGLTAAQTQRLSSRMADLRKNPHNVLTWEQIVAYVRDPNRRPKPQPPTG